ncbi:ubiquitin-like autophagy protein Apg12-domain-containing protein [Lophiotrema nucula]|uniref:Ubiquitin-like protein ATG12 n=1 Tax=Lophiotrema nucula TaxID=690887 RepID=A0A6A5ZCQ9_9PLEO|nr:ubiquitin-like autophagy protein Apg12-domain-containing protein [Lophiotrema nucula]
MSNAPEERIEEDEDTAEAPLTMAASMILGTLPKDASKALESAGTGGPEKVKIRLQPISGAPALKQKVFLLTSSQRFEVIITHLRKKLKVKPHESVHCYVGNVFSPSLDEVVINLWNCFKSNDELVVGYAMTPAFG